MFNKDTFRLIKRTHKRFLTLFLMVMIGVAFMVGVMSSSPILQKSVDIYDDQNNLMDVQIYSSYGFCDDDIKAIKDTSGVLDVFGSKFIDAKALDEGKSYVTRIQEVDAKINKFELTSGRMPSKDNEALALEADSFGNSLKIGDTVVLSLEDDVKDNLKYDRYEIVGLVKSPQYMTETSETSTLDNLPLNSVIYVSSNNFKSEYYTTIYVTFDDAKDKLAFSEEYDKYIEKMSLNLDRTKNAQEAYLKNTIIKEAEKEIEDGEKELEAKVSEANEKINDAQKQLDDAYIKLSVGKAQIELNEKTIISGQTEIDTNKAILDSNAQTVNNAIKEVEKANGDSFDNIYKKIDSLYHTYITLESSKDQEKIENQIKQNNEIINRNLDEIKNNQLLIDELEAKLDKTEDDINKLSELKKSNALLEVQNKTLEELNKVLSQTLTSNPIDEILKKMDEEVGNGGVKAVYANLTKLKDGKKQLDEAYQKLDEAIKQLESGKVQLEEAKKQVVQGETQYNAGVKELARSKYELETEVEKAQNELAKARQDLKELPDASWMILDRDSHYSSLMFDNTIDQMANIGLIFPLLFFLVAALVCLTTMTRLIDEERSQLGIFSALGFSKNKIISKYLIYASLASISGSIFGLIIGIFTFPVVIYNAWYLMYNLPKMHLYLPIGYSILGVLSFTILMVGVTYYVARRELKEQPSTLMRPKPPKNAKKVFLEHISFIWKNLSFTSKITARNIIRYKSRFFMTVIGVAGCTGLLVAGFGIKDSIADIIKIQYGEVFDYTNTINLEDDYNLDKIVSKLNEDSNNDQVVSFSEYASKVYLDEVNKTITVNVFDDRQIDRVMNLRERVSQNKLDIHGDGVIISEKFAKSNGIEVGDMIDIESKNGIKATVIVDGICEMYFQHYLFMSDNVYEDLFNENIHHEKIAVRALDSAKLTEEFKNAEGVLSIVDFKPMVDNFENMIDALDIIIIAIIIAAGSLAFVVLMNLTEVNISERLREIATLKVLGFNDIEVNSYIFKEILLLTIIGALVGLPLGKLEHFVIMSVIDMEMVMYGMNIQLMSYVYAFGITLIFTGFVLLIMSKSLKKIEMVESLKSVE